MPVAIVIDETATGIPTFLGTGLGQAGLLRNIGKGSIAVIVIEDDSAPIGHNQIIESVVVVVADTAALTPARASEAGLFRDVGECSVTVVVKKEVRGLAVRGKLGPRAINKENI